MAADAVFAKEGANFLVPFLFRSGVLNPFYNLETGISGGLILHGAAQFFLESTAAAIAVEAIGDIVYGLSEFQPNNGNLWHWNYLLNTAINVQWRAIQCVHIPTTEIRSRSEWRARLMCFSIVAERCHWCGKPVGEFSLAMRA